MKKNRTPQKTNAPAAVPASPPVNALLSGRRGNAAALAVILVVVLLTFWPALRSGFINWDDPQYVTSNPVITGPGWKAIFAASPLGYYHPLTVLGYKIIYTVAGGPKPAAFHAAGIGLHLVNCALVYYFALALRCGALPALLTALLFAVHPTRAEPVSWIADMKDLLSCTFFMGMLLIYLRYLKREAARAAARWCWLAASTALFAAALLSKPTILTGALVLFLLDWNEGRAWSKRIIFEKLPFFLAGVAAYVLTLKLGSFFLEQKAALQPLKKLALCGYTSLFYLSKILYPAKLSALYPHVPMPADQFLACLPAVLLVAAGIWLLRAGLRPYALGVWFFAVTLFPSLPFAELFPADRYIYLPALGVFCAAGAAFAAFYRKAKTPAAAVAAVLILALAWNCHARVKLWGNAVGLWDDTLAKYQLDTATKSSFASRARSYRGVAQFELNRFEEALADFNTALELAPARADVAEVYYWVGNCNFRLGRHEPAALAFGKALELNPNDRLSRNNHGSALMSLGRYEEAETDFNAALKLAPQYAEAYLNRGKVRFLLKRYEPAIEDFSSTLAITPSNDVAFYLRGRAELILKRRDTAVADLDRSLQLNPANGAARDFKLIAEKLPR